MIYSILDSKGICINNITWDGVSDWSPPEGCFLVEDVLNVGSSYFFDSQLNKWFLIPPPLPSYEEASSTVRKERDFLLSQSDWTQLPDVPLDQETVLAWRVYREDLRLIPSQEGFPWNVNWPTPPQ